MVQDISRMAGFYPSTTRSVVRTLMKFENFCLNVVKIEIDEFIFIVGIKSIFNNAFF